jgi:hypothetical protein
MDHKNSFYLIFKQLTLQNHYSVFSWFNVHYIIKGYTAKYALSSSEQKFNCIEKLRHDIFVTYEFYNKMIDFICKAQKIYWAFSRLAYKYKVRKAILKIDMDLYLNPIDTKSMYAIDIYQDRFIYRFTLQNLIQYIEGAITNTQGFISVPLVCKNPYNNIPFSRATLYDIYFRVKSSDLVLPDLFHRFFLCSFNLKLFALENESLIRERAILNYLNKSPHDVLCDEINHMFDVFPFHSIKISNKFPKDELVHIMKPYLYLFLIHKYSINNPEIKNRAYYFLKMKILELARYNPRFGRKHMIKKNGNGFGAKTTYVLSFNTEHPKFTMNCIKSECYQAKNMYTQQSYHEYYNAYDTMVSNQSDNENETNETETQDSEDEHNDNADQEDNNNSDDSDDEVDHDGNTVVHENNGTAADTTTATANTNTNDVINSDNDSIMDEDEVEDYNDF